MNKYTYKDSGIEWLRDIPEHWSVKRLCGICNIVRGNSTFQKNELLSKGKYVALQYGKTYKVEEINEQFKFYVNDEFYKNSQIVNYGDVIFVSTSETIEDLGHSVFYKRKDLGLIGGEQILLKPNKNILDEKYLFYSSKVIGKELNKFASGIKVFRFDVYDLKTIYTTTPPLKEQKAIAEYLDKTTAKIDRIIAIKKEQLVKMEEMRKSAFFKACTQGLYADAEFIEINDGHITKIPSHWAHQKLKRGCKNIDTGKTPSSGEPEYFIDGTIEWFAPECFNEGLVIDKPKKMINQKAFDDNQIKIYPSKSVYFVAVGATVGKVGIIQKPSSCNQQINILETNFKLLPEFLAYQMKIIEKEIIKFAQYTTLPILNQAKTGYLQMAFPPVNEQNEIVKYLDNYTGKLHKIKKSIQSQIETLQAYRKSLIHECVTGKKQITTAIKN
jgi:type I restriction enzyme S subunit